MAAMPGISLWPMLTSYVQMKRPLIGITMSHSVKKGSPYDYVNQSYVHAVEMAGGVPVPLPNAGVSSELLTMCDGVLFTGGGDVHPKYYGEELAGTDPESVEENRDSVERDIFKQARASGIPVLGICRGIQTIAVFAGGTLIQDIASLQQKNGGGEPAYSHRQSMDRHKPSHSITIRPGTRLHSIQEKETRDVNSLHHQAVNRVPDGWIVSAFAQDGIIEAIERPGQPFMLAVQWHPEELAPENADDFRLFEALVKEALNRSVSND